VIEVATLLILLCKSSIQDFKTMATTEISHGNLVSFLTNYNHVIHQMIMIDAKKCFMNGIGASKKRTLSVIDSATLLKLLCESAI
jgi:hypothetical protein